MKEKKTVAQQVAELTPKEKKNIMTIGIIYTVIGLLLIGAMVFVFLQYQGLNDAAEEARSAYYTAKEEKGILSADAELDLWDKAAEESTAFGRFTLYFSIGGFVAALFGMVGVYSLFPYYKDRRFYYLLTHKDAR